MMVWSATCLATIALGLIGRTRVMPWSIDSPCRDRFGLF
jgi:hypothetical protein